MSMLKLTSLILSFVLLLTLFPMDANCQLIHDAIVYFDRSSERVVEGGDITFYVNYYNEHYWLVGGSTTTITVRANGGNASYGSNYTATLDGTPFNSNGVATVSFVPYYLEWRTFEITVHANDTIRTDLLQQFTLEASGYKTVVGSPGSNTLWIDKLPAVQFQAVQESVNEGNAINIGVVRSGATYIPSSIDYTYTSNATRGGTFTASPVPRTLNFAPYETVKYITVSTVDDGYFEYDYNVTLRLQDPVGARLVNTITNNLTVVSTSAAPTVQFQNVSESVLEGGSVNVTVARTGDVSNTVSKVELQMTPSQLVGNYTISANNISLNDYRITFDKGEAKKTITINASTNTYYEDTRDINFTLAAVNGGKAAIGTKSSNILTIVDDTPLPVIEFGAVSQSLDEGNAVNITLRRTGASNIVSSVDFTHGVVVGDEGGSYTLSLSRTVTFNRGQTEANLTVTTRDDVIYGNDYRLNFTLKDPVRATIGDSRTNILTVYDTTPLPYVEFQISSFSVAEENSVNLTIIRSGAKNIESIVSYRFNSQSSTNVGRFIGVPPLNSNIIFDPNETTKAIKISINQDNLTHYQAEVAYFELYGVKNISVGQMSLARVDIIDTTQLDPVPPDVFFVGTGAVVNNGETCQLTIKRSSYEQASNVTLDRVSGSASSTVDYSTSVPLPYTVHFDKNDKGVKTITVSINSSAQGEKSVTFGLYRIENDAIPKEPLAYTLTIHGMTPPPEPTPEPTPIPTPAPDTKPLYVNANLDTEQIIVGYEGKITIRVTDGVSPVSGASVSIDRTGGQVIMLNPATDGNGVCYATFRSDNPGQYSLTVTATASGYDAGTATLTAGVVNSIPGSLTVNTMVKQQPVVIGSEAEVTVNVLDGGTPVPGATVKIETTSGYVTPSSGTTDNDGNLFAMFHSADPGAYILTVTTTASGHPTSRVSYAVQVVSPEERHLYATMNIDPKSVSPNSEATVTVLVTDGVMPVSNAQVSLVSTGGTISPASGVTDSDGKFVARFTSGAEGTYTLGVNAFSEGIGQASYSTFIKVKQGMFDMQILMYFVVAVIIIAIVLIILVTLIEKWMANDLRIIPKVGAIPADGMSRLPVRIEIFNGFGRPKKVRGDTYVELEATAGRIESVTIPSGRSYADAVLMSSKEFGPVSIKAKLGDKAMASVPVEFKLEGGSLAVTITPGVLIADRKSSASINIRIRNSKGNYVVPLADKVIELNTTMGDIVGSVISMPARTNSANATIVSGGEGGIATVTATMGTMKGTGRVEFRGVSRKLCANCGEPIPGNLPSCPSCGTMVATGEKVAEASTS